MLESLDAPALRRWCAGGLAALRRHQGEIDALNVYPVPDGDTGTNLVLTLTSASEALAFDNAAGDAADSGATEAGRVLRLMARGALLGARGNSGVIVSQILRGLADATAAVPSVGGRELARGLRAGAEAARGAVARPVEGTILSVADAAAGAAEAIRSGTLAEVAAAAAAAAGDALARTPSQLPALARAGVVDAGGRGLCVLLDALVETVTGVAPPPAPPPPAPRGVRPSLVAARETGSDAYDYEVQFLLDAPEPAVEKLRARLAELGDSLVVVGTGEAEIPTWNVHVHVNDVGAAIEAGVEAGRPHRITVTRFADAPSTAVVDVGGGPDRAVVVVAPGDGLASLFAAEGAAVVGANPSTAELLAAIAGTGARHVVVLPNDPNTQPVAAAAAREAPVPVRVVPTRSPVQALAALAVRDPARPFDDDVIEMAKAAGACRYAEVCYASRDALTVAGPCRTGDVLALVEGEVHLIGTDLADTCRALLDALLGGGGELVTLVTGADAPEGLADTVAAHAAARWPFAEVQAYRGGHPHYPLLVGVE